MDSEKDGEEWRPVVGYEGWYEVSSLGKVRRLRNRYGNPQCKYIHGDPVLGYPTVRLRAKGGMGKRRPTVAIHILVARAFLGPCPAGYEVNHKDFNRANPVLSNLEYVTHSENNLHAFRNGRRPVTGSRHGRAKLTEAQVRFIRESDKGPAELARLFGVRPNAVYLARKGKTWKMI